MKLTLQSKVDVLTTASIMIPVGTMIKDKLSGLYTADERAITLRDKLLSKGLIKKVTQEVTEVASEEVVEEAPEARDIHEVNIKLLELEGIERAFSNIEYLHGLFDKRLARGDFRVTSSEEKLMEISEGKIKGFKLDEVKGEIRALKKEKRVLLDEIKAAEAKKAAEAQEAAKAQKAAAKDTKLIKQVIKEIITEDVAEATDVDESIVHKILVKITRQRSVAKARAVKARKAKAKVKAKAKTKANVWKLLGSNIRALTNVVHLMNHTNVSMKEAWDWFHKYATI